MVEDWGTHQSSGNGTNPTNDKGVPISAENLVPGTSYNASVMLSLQPSNSVNVDGTRGGIPNFIVASHELSHASLYLSGNWVLGNISMYDHDRNVMDPAFDYTELYTRMHENIIRRENGITFRAFPIPIYPFPISTR